MKMKSPRRKLTPADQAVIHALHAKGDSDRAIAKRFNVSHTCIAYVLDPAKAPWRREAAKRKPVTP